MIDLQQTYDTYLKQINKSIHNIDTNSYESIQQTIYDINLFLTKYHDDLKSNKINTDELKRKVDMLDSHYDNKYQQDQKKQIDRLTFINFTFLLLGFCLSYVTCSIKDLGPDFIIKSKHGEIFLILLFIVIILISYYLFRIQII
jgi:hypothetical protein